MRECPLTLHAPARGVNRRLPDSGVWPHGPREAGVAGVGVLADELLHCRVPGQRLADLVADVGELADRGGAVTGLGSADRIAVVADRGEEVADVRGTARQTQFVARRRRQHGRLVRSAAIGALERLDVAARALD